ncbi:hypothetical protein ABT373_26980 [Streptomyces sp. NPDC000070]|uniref:GHMP family kinase ATP-binding protein n=1 Tax=Streptomyces sp. NPDC000070 TaxID=3154240 RepID=UPI0033296816
MTARDTAADRAGATASLVVARAPLRVSLAGGGTDLPSYADRFGGVVISLAIDRYVGVTAFPRSFGGGVRMCWEDVEQVDHAEELRHRFARAALLDTGTLRNIQMASCADAPSSSGLGGSGAFTVALLHALLHQDGPAPQELAERAAAIEMRDLGRPVGKHDHYMAALGGLRLLRIGKDRSVRPESLPIDDRFESYVRERLLLFFTGVNRDAGQVLSGQDRLTRRGNVGTLRGLRSIHALAAEMLVAVTTGRVDDVGPLLDAHWQAKRELSEGISNDRTETLYKVGREAGADGGKLLGAGGGGFLLLSSGAGRADEIRAAMADQNAQELPFGPDTTGSQVVGLSI